MRVLVQGRASEKRVLVQGRASEKRGLVQGRASEKRVLVERLDQRALSCSIPEPLSAVVGHVLEIPLGRAGTRGGVWA